MFDLINTVIIAAGAWLNRDHFGETWLVYLANLLTLVACTLAASPLTRGIRAVYWMMRIERASAAEALQMSLTALAEVELHLDGATDRRTLVARLRAYGRTQIRHAVSWIATALLFATGLPH